MNLSGRMALAVLASTLPTQAFAQTQAQQDRMNRVAQFVVTAPMCERFLGMTMARDLPEKADAAFRIESASWQIDPTTLNRLAAEAVDRQSAMLATDLDSSAKSAKTDAQLRKLKSILIGYGRTCESAISDPIFSSLLIAPAGYDLDRAATIASDDILEVGGGAGYLAIASDSGARRFDAGSGHLQVQNRSGAFRFAYEAVRPIERPPRAQLLL